MATPETRFADLSDDQLLAEVQRLAGDERRATAALVRSLMELDRRRLFLGEGCSSLFTYCTQVLHLGEGSAYNRIEAARAAGRFPLLLRALDDGSLTLTAVRLLAPHLRPDNHDAVIASARHKTKREIELLIAGLSPRPAAPTFIRKLPERRRVTEKAIADETAVAALQDPSVRATPISRAVAAPLSLERYKVQLTVSRDTYEKLRRTQNLLRHTIPTGDPAEIFDRALTLLLEALERRRYAATPSPRCSREATPGSRHIPAAVKRAVWKRDEGQCAFAGSTGRCSERGFLEFHHIQPYAAGGAATVENIQLRCRQHNAHEASLFFGNSSDRAFVKEARLPWPLGAIQPATAMGHQRAVAGDDS
jgi:hypothetical protein